jgi:hypothetical protein
MTYAFRAGRGLGGTVPAYEGVSSGSKHRPTG